MTWQQGADTVTEKAVVFVDVDAPHDLTASNIQTESGMLTWKPPRADITGYILSFESADGTIRVSSTTMPLILVCLVSYTLNLYIVLENKMSEHVSPSRRWSWVPLLSLITWLSSAPPQSIQSSCRPLLVLRGAESSLLSSPPVSGQITVLVVCVSVATHLTMYWIQPWL